MQERKTYTPEEKAAYWKAKALSAGASRRQKQGVKYSPAQRAAYWRKVAQNNYSQGQSSTAVKSASKSPGALSGAGAAAGGALGTFLGGPAGTAIGSFLGGKLGHLVEHITGFGDYKIEKNTIMTGGMSPPSVINSINRAGVVVRHREYVGDILATTAFTIQTFNINPGLPNTFPWLSQIASAFEQYKLRGMLFEFLSTSSDALLSSATSTALGTVNMATEYDVAEPVFPDKRTMLNHEWSNSRKPSCTFVHPIECKKAYNAQNAYFVRSAAVPGGFDQRQYDFARFSIATEGMQADGGVLGELWITYEVELMKQQFGFLGLTDHFRLSLLTDAAPLGVVTGSNTKSGGTIGGVINGPGTAYSFPPHVGSGMYLLTWYAKGTVAAAVDNPNFVFTNCIGVNHFVNDTANHLGAPTDGTLNLTTLSQLLVRVTAQGAIVTWASVVVPTGVTAGDLIVTRVADSLLTNQGF